ncbi:MAG TPA: DNA-binding protein WhiA [Mobilitalea sp.]|nr:DNA-binding protein WhiA [Mobilitalea sp.]
MSFSKDVKDELSLQLSSARHCRLAELASILSYGGRIIGTNTGFYLRLQTESIDVARKYFTLIRKTFNINNEISIKINSQIKKNRIYTLIIRDTEDINRILQATKLFHGETEIWEKDNIFELGKADQLIVQNVCCKRAFIRGAFLTSGSMSNPKTAYHLEIVVSEYEKAEQLRDIIQTFSIDAKIVMRKKNYVVYIKEGSQIVDLLNVMEAHVALMNLENVRILKEMRNQVNRQVNCEAANISKTVAAASKQIDDIIYIRDTVGFGDLAEGLEDIAKLRIQHPEASLKELGSMLVPPIGKSGVNHRLRKLSLIADLLREHKEENSHDNEGNCN